MLYSRIMTGNKCVVKVVVYVLILCILLAGCSHKTDSYNDDGINTELISETIGESIGTTETTVAVTEEEAQDNTKANGNTMPDDEAISEISVPSTESTERLSDSFTATTPRDEDDVIQTTTLSTAPGDDTATTTPGNDGNDMLGYGVELPDDNWN